MGIHQQRDRHGGQQGITDTSGARGRSLDPFTATLQEHFRDPLQGLRQQVNQPIA